MSRVLNLSVATFGTVAQLHDQREFKPLTTTTLPSPSSPRAIWRGRVRLGGSAAGDPRRDGIERGGGIGAVGFTPNNGRWAAHPSQHLAVGL